MKILVTGFNSFKGARVNPSEQVVLALAGRQRNDFSAKLVTAILPTEYVAAARRLRHLIRTEWPDAVLCLGVAPRRKSISLERVALNLNDDPTADNAGVIRQARKIAPDGPDVYWSSLPLEAFGKRLRRRGIKALVSNHAGTFLCNHAFYVARQETTRAGHGIPCGFIHLPGLGRSKSTRVRSLNRMIRAVECCINVLGTGALRKKSRPTSGG
ncbi:MAG: hypothetical protein HY651_00175 [Acidobacteria bacterium]|nr:hypothetical protein [Acidobacteriota bacterium]